MAMGIYVGAGSVKTVSGIYVGAGGVKTVKEVYVGAGGVKKVWPSYTDYGGDSPDIYANGYVNRYGYYRQDGTSPALHGTATASTTENSTAATAYTAGFNLKDVYHFFSTNNPFDARGYNYLVYVYVLDVRMSTTTTNGHNLAFWPFISLSSVQNIVQPSDSEYTFVRGSGNDSTKQYNKTYTLCTFVDISSVTSEDLYLLTGYAMYTSNDNYTAYGRLTADSGFVRLYKDKSDCNINGSDYNYSFEMTV